MREISRTSLRSEAKCSLPNSQSDKIPKILAINMLVVNGSKLDKAALYGRVSSYELMTLTSSYLVISTKFFSCQKT